MPMPGRLPERILMRVMGAGFDAVYAMLAECSRTWGVG